MAYQKENCKNKKCLKTCKCKYKLRKVGKDGEVVGQPNFLLLSIAKMKREWPKANWSVTDSIKTRDHDNEFWLAVIREGAGFDHGKFWRCVTGFAHLLNLEKLHNRHLIPSRTGGIPVTFDKEKSKQHSYKTIQKVS